MRSTVVKRDPVRTAVPNCISLLGTALMLGVFVIAVNTYSSYPTFISKFRLDVTGNGHSWVVSEYYLPAIFLLCILILVYMRQSIVQLSLNVNETVPNCCQCLHEDKTKLLPYLQNRARLTEALNRRLWRVYTKGLTVEFKQVSTTVHLYSGDPYTASEMLNARMYRIRFGNQQIE